MHYVLAKAIFAAWTSGVPLLALGLLATINPIIVMGSAVLVAGVALNATHAITILTSR